MFLVFQLTAGLPWLLNLLLMDGNDFAEKGHNRLSVLPDLNKWAPVVYLRY